MNANLLKQLEMEGMLSFEEIDAFEEYESDIKAAGKILKPGKSEDASVKIKRKKKTVSKPKQSKFQKKEVDTPVIDEERLASFEGLEQWKKYELNEKIMMSLKDNGFHNPTEIQKSMLDSLHEVPRRDVIGTAPTGSGKTLAFGIPILNEFLKNGKMENSLFALVLVPTRELGIQVADHFKSISKYASIQVVSIIGGISEEKQLRLLNYSPDVIIATPGRFWEHVSNDNGGLKEKMRNLRFLVFDEVDRMMEKGHFKELNQILSSIYYKPNESFVEGWVSNETKSNLNTLPQAFLFSATLTSKDELIANFTKKIKFSDKKPTTINLASNFAVAEKLEQSHMFCLKEEKDFYLYYFLIKHPGKTLVFVNSIDAIRRLIPMLILLKIKVFGIHAQMQQRQRLKNLDRFRDSNECVLVASDVAARGLDICDVDHVIHYQLPRDVETYIHRSGRTARANKSGLSLALVSEDEVSSYKKICSLLRKPEGLPEFPYDMNIITKLKKRVIIARQIDEQEHKLSKEKHDVNWESKAREAFEIDGEFKNEESSQSKKMHSYQLKKQKEILNSLLDEPIASMSDSLKYPTSSSCNLAAKLVTNLSNPKILGDPILSALEMLKARKKSKK